MPHSQCTFHRRWAPDRLELQALTVPYCARASLKSDVPQVWWFGTSFLFACAFWLSPDCFVTFEQEIPATSSSAVWKPSTVSSKLTWTLVGLHYEEWGSRHETRDCQSAGSMMFVSCKICGLLFLVIRADMHSWHVFVYRAALRLGCSWPCDWMALLASWHAGMLFPSCLVSVSRTLTARLCRIGTKNGFKTLDWKDRGPNSGLLFNQLNFLRATSMSAHRFYKIRNRALLRWEFHWFQMVSACFSQYKVHLAQSLLHAIKPGGCYGWY